MDDESWQTAEGIVVPGHKVASGFALDSPYPRGTVEMQIPFFRALGLDLTECFQGTLNISISPSTFRVTNPERTFRGVEWTDRHPPEDFSFSRCRLLFRGLSYRGWIYYPHPETKQRNFQDPSTLEAIVPLVPGISYGARVDVEYSPLEIALGR
ncbi:MAG: hypothetical protein WBG38_08370 [Nodosilinea sp.]